MSRIKGQDGGEPKVPEVWGEALGLHTPAVWASLVEGAKEAGPGRGPGSLLGVTDSAWSGPLHLDCRVLLSPKVLPALQNMPGVHFSGCFGA